MPKPISFNQTPEPWFLNAIQVCNRKGHIVVVCYIVNVHSKAQLHVARKNLRFSLPIYLARF